MRGEVGSVLEVSPTIDSLDEKRSTDVVRVVANGGKKRIKGE